jgi:hypothetical protein
MSNNLDAGYLFVTEEYDRHRPAVYRWGPGKLANTITLE